jgi:iron complex transport system ATP-binding protein
MVILQEGRVMHQGACADSATHRALEQVFGQRIAVQAVGATWVALPAADLG